MVARTLAGFGILSIGRILSLVGLADAHLYRVACPLNR